jgi:hypothetical protein
MIWVGGVSYLKCFACKELKKGSDGIDVSRPDHCNNLCRECRVKEELERESIAEYMEYLEAMLYE